jgi:excisionase family DNA binding protein
LIDLIDISVIIYFNNLVYAMTFSDTIYLTPAEAARRLSVSPITLRTWAAKGLIRVHITLGGHRRYPLSEVERLMAKTNEAAPLRVMIVDDDSFTIELILDYLADTSFPLVVETALDGFEAGQKLLSFKPDVMLLDLMMPGMDGFAVCNRIKSDPDTAATRVIAMSGHATAENCQRVMNEGAEACISKPFNREQLVESLTLQP